MTSVSNSNRFPLIGLLAVLLLFTGSCGVYSFKDVSIPPEIKTIRIGFIENRARIVDPQLSPQLTDRVKTKVNNQTKLTQVESADVDYDVTAYISDYSVSTSGVSAQAAASNRLTVTVHLELHNRLADQKKGTPDFQTDLSRNFDFSAGNSLSDAQATLLPTILSNMTDEIFNRLFSNW
jgi:hypothetical protein